MGRTSFSSMIVLVSVGIQCYLSRFSSQRLESCNLRNCIFIDHQVFTKPQYDMSCVDKKLHKINSYDNGW